MRDKELIIKLSILAVFGFLFIMATLSQWRNTSVFGIGLPFENYLVMLLSFLSLVRIFWSIHRH